MEWSVPVNEMLKEEITKIGHTLLPPGFHGDIRSVRVVQDSLSRLIDALGEQSAAAQGLSKVITMAEKLRNAPTHTLYLLKDQSGNGGKGEIVGLLKVGRKHLFLFDERATVREVEPMCVLDFFVRADRQRQGLGRRLFDYMLQDEGLRAEQLAIDGPSPKMEQFLLKNYGVERLVRQNNNFAVSPDFFAASNATSQSGRNTPVVAPAVGRFAAHKPPSAIATVIHGGGPPAYHTGSRSTSRVATPDVHLSNEVPATPAKTPEPEPKAEDQVEEALAALEVDTEPSPERPNSLQVETVTSPAVPPHSPAGSAAPRRDSQLTDRGYFDVKFYHNKLW